MIHGEEGSAVVETALSLSVLFCLVFGVMEMSLAFYSYNVISEAAREGTRYAVVRGSACSGFASACPATAANVQNYVRGLGFPGMVPAQTTVTTTWPDSGASCTPSSSPCNNPGNNVKVVVQYQIPLSIPFASTLHLNMSSTSEMVISE